MVLERALRKVDSYAHLRRDWDSYGAPPISPLSRKTAKRFLKFLVNNVKDVSDPIIGPTAEGGITLIWRKNRPRRRIYINCAGRRLRLFIVLGKTEVLDQESFVPTHMEVLVMKLKEHLQKLKMLKARS